MLIRDAKCLKSIARVDQLKELGKLNIHILQKDCLLRSFVLIDGVHSC